MSARLHLLVPVAGPVHTVTITWDPTRDVLLAKGAAKTAAGILASLQDAVD